MGQQAYLLVGALGRSSRWRGVLADAEDFPHLVEAFDTVVRKLGGVTHGWRFAWMATSAPRPPARSAKHSRRWQSLRSYGGVVRRAAGRDRGGGGETGDVVFVVVGQVAADEVNAFVAGDGVDQGR